MRKLLPFLKKYKLQSILAPFFKMLEAMMDLLVPLVVAAIIDRGIAEGDRPFIIGRFAFLILLAALGLGFSISAQWMAARASVGVASDVRRALFDHIQRFSYTDLDKMGTDTLITRMTSDVNQVQNGINMALRLLLRSPFIVFGSMIMAFTIDVRCALIFVVAIPVLGVIVFGIMVVSIPLFKKTQEALDRLLGITRENLTGVRVIRAFCKEKEEIDEFDRQNQALTKLNEFVGRLSALMNPLTYVLINIATIFLIRQGALRVNMGAIRQGDVVALYNYMAQMIVELIKLASLIITINKGLACADRVSAVLDEKPGMEFPGSAVAAAATRTVSVPAVRFDHVSFGYANAGANAVDDIDFTVQKGQTIGIIGGTGSGKSTVVNLIPRFYDATEGRVLVDGIDVKDYPEGSLIPKIGVVPQKAVLFEGTIRDNLKWGNEDASDEELMEAVELAQAKEVVEGKRGGLSAMIEQNGRNFSGGQKQRLTIARALVKKPEILILDDSASALDMATDQRLRTAIRGLSFNPTVFIVSQRASGIRDADMILVLDDGHIAGSGTHEQLMDDCETYREIYYSQFPEERKEAAL
ncbi:MAG: ABC transporter ATP-binding protein [Blautia sp.]|nr:ABC transporter ATP-binding protein [Blautia sp.]